jgi:hypothetical protein
MCARCEIHRKTASISPVLHRVYDSVVKEPVPAALEELLAKLK